MNFPISPRFAGLRIKAGSRPGFLRNGGHAAANSTVMPGLDPAYQSEHQPSAISDFTRPLSPADTHREALPMTANRSLRVVLATTLTVFLPCGDAFAGRGGGGGGGGGRTGGMGGGGMSHPSFNAEWENMNDRGFARSSKSSLFVMISS